MKYYFYIVFFVCVFDLVVVANKTQKPSEIDLLFLTKIKPLMKEKCMGCHGENPDKIKGEYIMLTRDEMLAGGESGEKAIIPGQPEQSYLIELIRREIEDEAMPPKKADALTSAQVGWFVDWVAAGAPWPEDSMLKNNEEFVQVKTSGGLSEDWTHRRYEIEAIWGFQPIVKSELPEEKKDVHPIDYFIDRKLKELDLVAADRAEPSELLKRTYLGLTGFLPTVQERELRLRDTSPSAFEALVDDLLQSPHYGEQMAKNWLDVVRYADTSGYSNDFERPNAWRYRDYVVRAFNRDKPYNRFILEQLAGDELGEDDPELEIATGFLRMGPWEHTSMEVAAVSRQLFLDDVTSIVGEVFLGHNMTCAKCHDHKFDPIPTKDFYRMQAVFAPVQFAAKKVPFLKTENTSSFERGKAYLNDMLTSSRGKMKEEVQKFKENEPLMMEINGLYRKQLDIHSRSLNRFEPYAYSVYNGKLRVSQSKKYEKFENIKPNDIKGDPQSVHILTGGSLESKGEKVTPGVLSALPGSDQPWSKIPDSVDGRRLAFAKWLIHPENALTSRVIVNRVWQQHFGHGLVRTGNAFGKMGAKPTHPELLDYLAHWFMNKGEWSFKKLHKLIMTSKAYQRSTHHPSKESVLSKDPDLKYLAVRSPRRLSAEEIYDNLLAITEELNREMGGPPVFPEINWEVALQTRLIMGSIAPAYQPSPLRKDRHRRTLYAFVRRSLGDPMMEVFNKPTSDLSCSKRDETTVAPQALSLFNAESIYQRALSLGKLVGDQDLSIEGSLSMLYQKVYSRYPTAKELNVVSEFYREMFQAQKSFQPDAYELPKIFNSKHIAEKTGEILLWQEPLTLMKQFQRDPVAWQLSPKQRTLAEISRVLFNSNEFLYVY